MNITICASKSFDRQAEEVAAELRQRGHVVQGPRNLELWPEHGSAESGEAREFTREYDIMRRHFARLKASDALLVLNYEKDDMPGYIGGGVLMEMGFAHVLHEPIYLINPIPNLPYRDEIELMQPVVIGGDFAKIPFRAPRETHPASRGFCAPLSRGDSKVPSHGGARGGLAQAGSMKRVKTFDAQGRENGLLMELLKKERFTMAYLTCVYPGCFKGYHLHRVRATNYVAVRGTMNVILYVREGTTWKRQEHILESAQGTTLHIPTNVATGFRGATDEEAWMINFPEPPYDPELKDEQVEYTEDELERGVLK